MANLGQNGFDATHVDPTVDFEHVPAGRYAAEITDSDMRDNSKGTGEYLWLEFTILDGPCAGRKLWTQLNLVNPSSQAVEIAQRELSAICHAAGKLRVQDSIELHNIPLQINVKVKPDPEYGPQNIIRGFKMIGDTRPGPTRKQTEPVKAASTGKEESPAPAPATGTSVPPWKRK
ncbi:MAG: DUF669 domain-containing protein [Candidatus Electryoneaceae bacterium]|nr:DUF669 domain-containing protein [Candidatus Electryoneaceae bacterium]